MPLRRRLLVNLGLLLALLFLELALAERTWVTLLLCYAPQVLIVAPFLLLPLWALFRGEHGDRGLAVLTGLLVAATFGGFELPSPPPRGTGPAVSLISYNVRSGVKDLPGAMELLAARDPDLICLQETDVYDPRYHVEEAVQERFGDRWIRTSRELTTISRWPLREVRDHVTPSGRTILETVVETPAGPLRVLNVHLTTGAGPALLRRRPAHLIAELKRRRRDRVDEVGALLAVAGESRLPLVIAGDFNTPPRGILYGLLASRYDDAFDARGFGFGSTFRADIPVLRIDYAWLGNGVRAGSCRPLPSRASDHRPLFVELVLPNP